MKRASTLIVICIFALVLSGCANRKNISPLPAIDPETKQQMAEPVNCQTAEQDIAILEEEKASTGKRILAGARSVMPIGAAVGILLGDYRDRVQVATGKYNDDLEAKIVEIKTTCNLP